MIEARALSVRYGAVVALDDLSLLVQPGEVLCLLGANGAGKTTLINVLMGFVRPDAGSARVDGVDVEQSPLEARRRLGFVPEQVMLYGALTGLENLRFFNELAVGPRLPDDLTAALERVGLTRAEAGRPVSTYSKGMRQKVALAVALAKGARALVLDEPLSGLDPSAAGDFSARLRALGRDGHAVLVTTHDLLRARDAATRIGIMRQGKLVQLLDADSVDHAELEAAYLQITT